MQTTQRPDERPGSGQPASEPPSPEQADGESPETEQADAHPGQQDEAEQAGAARGGREASRWWGWALGAICLVALVVRLIYVFGWQDIDEVGGDAYYYHASANLLADGEGFVHPYAWDEGVRAPGADHPPGYTVVLAVSSLFGFDSIRSHQVVTVLIGTATVALMGVLGRRIAGRGVGLLAAGFAAVYPNIWMNDPSLMSESLAMLAGLAFSLTAYWAWDRPSTGRLAGLGAVLGLAALVRAEAAMLLALVVLPVCLWAPALDGWRARLQRLAVATVATGVVVAPWVVPNLFRFEHPATFSTQLGPTLEVANCEEVYFGDWVGGWTSTCASGLQERADAGGDPGDATGGEVWRYRGGEPQEPRPEVTDPHDRSELDEVTREVALDYMRENQGRLPFVLWARFGRTWGLYAPDQQLKIDSFTDARPYDAARVGLGLYYLTAAAAVAGVVALRRRGVPSFPLTAWIVNVAVTVVVFYGTTRFRAPAEPALVILGAVGASWLFTQLRGRLAARTRSEAPSA